MPSLPFLFIAALYWLPLSISVYPYVTSPSGGIRVRAIIQQHADNRQLRLVALLNGTFEMRATPFQIDGAQSQRVFSPTNKCGCWVDLPSGQYEAIADLTRIEQGKERHFVARQDFQVVGFGVSQ